VQRVGSGITVHGYSNVSYSVALDGVIASNGSFVSIDSNVLFDKRDLPNGSHNITITIESDGRTSNNMLALDNAIVEYAYPEGYVSLST
jgi:hypothetical protein